MQLIPGGGDATNAAVPFVGPTKGAKKGVDKAVDVLAPNLPEVPEALPPPPSAQEPAISAAMEEARKKQTATDLKRRGRKASILTSARGVENELGVVNRPQARAAALLGQ